MSAALVQRLGDVADLRVLGHAHDFPTDLAIAIDGLSEAMFTVMAVEQMFDAVAEKVFAAPPRPSGLRFGGVTSTPTPSKRPRAEAP